MYEKIELISEKGGDVFHIKSVTACPPYFGNTKTQAYINCNTSAWTTPPFSKPLVKMFPIKKRENFAKSRFFEGNFTRKLLKNCKNPPNRNVRFFCHFSFEMGLHRRITSA
jgi:hypothetical protein